MKKIIYECDLCGEEMRVSRARGGWEYNTAMIIKLKYANEIGNTKKKKILICPACLAEIRSRLLKGGAE